MANPDKLAAKAADKTAVGTGEPATTDAVNLQAPEVNLTGKVEVTEEKSEAVAPAVTVRETAPVTAAPTAGETTTTTSRAKGSNAANAIQEQWLQYVLGANPRKPQSTKSITDLQRNLIRLIDTTVNLSDTQDFVQVSNYVIRLINEDKTGVFSGGAIYRYFDKGLVAPALTNQARFAIDAYLLFSDPDVRKQHIGVYNLENSAKLAKTVPLRERFIAYFNRISGNR